MGEHKKYNFDFTTDEGKREALKNIANIIETNDKHSLVKILYFLMEGVARHEVDIYNIFQTIE